MGKITINLGNYFDLHTGYHGTFTRYRSSGIGFKPTRPRIKCYLLTKNQKQFHPCQTFLYVEAHQYPQSARYIQSAYFPVINKVPWVADMDDICQSLLGRAVANRKLIDKVQKEAAKDQFYRKIMLARLGLFNSPYCRGILFRSLAGIQIAMAVFRKFRIDKSPEVRGFLDKVYLAYPAMPLLVKKVKVHSPVTILFMARDFENKGGDIALAVYEKLLKLSKKLRLIYCGPVPDKYRRRYASVLGQIEYIPQADHSRALELLKESDIYLFPTQFEGLGITLIEAKAAGCVPATYYGDNLEAVPEVVTRGKTGILLKKPQGRYLAKTEAERFYRAIKDLANDPARLAMMKSKAWQEVKKGKFSLKEHIKSLKILLLQKDIKPAGRRTLPFKYQSVKEYSADKYWKMLAGYYREHRLPRRIMI